ncbi:MAG: FtsQ-type POTRA domain-containing protein [Proteobacteria bacterium]|jgi:cell division protein FtsQ|nr:FtsQ-type POTRA domain-containing protein [Pseudomonadota bacterium]
MNLFRRSPRNDGERKRLRAQPASNGNRRRTSATPQAPGAAAGDDPPRTAKRKAVRAIARLALAVAATLLVLWGCVAAYGKATTAEYFSVTEIQIGGNVRLAEPEVIAAAAIERGVNIFRVDAEAIARRLEQHPWVLDATATRKLPRGLEIGIVERKVEAIVLFDVPYLVDDAGAVFKRWVPGDPTPPPTISGLDREQLRTDAEAVQIAINDAIALARRYRAQGLDRVAPIAEVHAEVDGGFSITAGADPFYVRFGKGPYRQKLARLSDLLRRLRADGERPAVIHFDNEIRPDRVTVKLKKRPPGEGENDVEVTRKP